MMNAIAFAAAFLLTPADTVTADDLARAYADVIEVARYGNSPRSPMRVLLIHEDSLPADHLLRGFLRDNGGLFSYLVTNGTAFDQAELLDGDGTVEEKERRFHAALLADTAFRGAADALAGAYLAREGHVIVGRGAAAQRTIDVEELQAIAVRFFYPDEIAPGGQLGGHICVGRNGLADHPRRDLVLEAIAFSALMDELRRDSRELRALFRGALTAAESLQLSADDETALARAQGVVWHALRDDPLIRSLLVAFVREREAWLPVSL